MLVRLACTLVCALLADKRVALARSIAAAARPILVVVYGLETGATLKREDGMKASLGRRMIRDNDSRRFDV